jgi:SAM-dependent MidA family methyltransferase
VTALLDEIVSRIRGSGPMPFAAFMAHALYHPRHGYYSSGDTRTGRSGHFLTSSELDPSYGHLWARGLEEIWTASGSPDRFEVVEIGPGEGGFAAALFDAATGPFSEALALVLVERVPEVAARQRARLEGAPITWVSSVTELPAIETGVVFANEVLDNLPVHLVEKKNGRLHEVCVTERDGGLMFELLPPSSPELERYLDRIGVELPDGHRFEVGLAAESLVRHARTAIRQGALVLVDYGMHAAELARRAEGTLVAYSSSGVNDDVLADPGSRDITAHANWTAVANAARAEGLEVRGPRSQRAVLLDLGAHELAASIRAARNDALASGEGASAVRALSRGQALNALLDPGGLGGLEVLVASAGLDPPRWITSS